MLLPARHLPFELLLVTCEDFPWEMAPFLFTQVPQYKAFLNIKHSRVVRLGRVKDKQF